MLRIYVDSCIPGGSHIGPDREGGDLPDKEVSERARRLEDHARGRQPQPQDQRHHPRTSDGSHKVRDGWRNIEKTELKAYLTGTDGTSLFLRF